MNKKLTHSLVELVVGLAVALALEPVVVGSACVQQVSVQDVGNVHENTVLVHLIED